MKECYICKTTQGLELHHILFGKDRKVADKWKLTVWLCKKHHTGDYSPHQNAELNLELKQMAQRKFLETGTMEQWMDVKTGIGKNYL